MARINPMMREYKPVNSQNTSRRKNDVLNLFCFAAVIVAMLDIFPKLTDPQKIPISVII